MPGTFALSLKHSSKKGNSPPTHYTLNQIQDYTRLSAAMKNNGLLKDLLNRKVSGWKPAGENWRKGKRKKKKKKTNQEKRKKRKKKEMKRIFLWKGLEEISEDKNKNLFFLNSFFFFLIFFSEKINQQDQQ